MQTIHIEDAGHAIVVSMTDTVLARMNTYMICERDVMALLKEVLVKLGNNVDMYDDTGRAVW